MAKSKKLAHVEKLYEGLPGHSKGLEVFKALAQAAKVPAKVVAEYERIMKMAETAKRVKRSRRSAPRNDEGREDGRF